MVKVTFRKLMRNWLRKSDSVGHFVQKCLEIREYEQNVVLDGSSEALGNWSEIVRILVLAMVDNSWQRSKRK